MSIFITQPESEKEFQIGTEINFQGTADNPISEVEIWIDDRWLVGKVTVNDGKWSFPYSFVAGGTFIVYAKGLDNSNTLIDVHDIWVFIESGIITATQSLEVMAGLEAPTIQLTPNFTLSEFTLSPTAIRLGIINTPTQTEIDRLRKLCQQILQPARDVLGPLKINSGYRSQALNDAVGGVVNSAHRLGHATDVIPLNVGTRALAKWIVDSNRNFDQVILEFGTDQNPAWIHVSSDPRNRRQILRQTKSGTVPFSL